MLFLALDYIRFSADVHPEIYHKPVILALLGPAALAVLAISVTYSILSIRAASIPTPFAASSWISRDDTTLLPSHKFDLNLPGYVSRYSFNIRLLSCLRLYTSWHSNATLVRPPSCFDTANLTSYVALDAMGCRTINLATLAAAWGIPFAGM